MTGNIDIRRAVFTTMNGEIVFSLNSWHGRYRLQYHAGEPLMLERLDRGQEQAPRRVTWEEVVTLINQGDDGRWTKQSFTALWNGWAEGYKAGRRTTADEEISAGGRAGLAADEVEFSENE